MEIGGALHGNMSLLCGQGVLLPPRGKAMSLRMFSSSGSEAMELGFCHGLGGSLQSFKLFAHKQCRIRLSSERRPNSSYSSYPACQCLSHIPMKRGILTQYHSDANNELKIHYNPKKPCRSVVVVRSELTGTGNPDATFPLTDLNLGSKLRGICFYGVTSIVAIFLFAVMTLQHPLVLLLDRHRRKAHHFVAKLWASLTVKPFFEIEFEGLENLPSAETPAVYVSNHQSFLDIYALLTLGRTFKFISKTSIFLLPIIGWAMFFLGVIPLKRMDSRSQMECLRRCMDLLKKGASVFFFPEGTRSKDGKLGVFKKGAFSVAAKSKVPVVPITLIGTGKLMPSGKEGTVNSGSVKVIIHKTIQGTNAQLLCDEARKVIAASL